MEDLNLTLYSDADFAGCLDTAKSTSGVFIALTGPNSFFPLNAISKSSRAYLTLLQRPRS